ncbi:unnamed protein product [Lampetra fluviatilis]
MGHVELRAQRRPGRGPLLRVATGGGVTEKEEEEEEREKHPRGAAAVKSKREPSESQGKKNNEEVEEEVKEAEEVEVEEVEEVEEEVEVEDESHEGSINVGHSFQDVKDSVTSFARAGPLCATGDTFQSRHRPLLPRLCQHRDLLREANSVPEQGFTPPPCQHVARNVGQTTRGSAGEPHRGHVSGVPSHDGEPPQTVPSSAQEARAQHLQLPARSPPAEGVPLGDTHPRRGVLGLLFHVSGYEEVGLEGPLSGGFH